MTLEKELYRCNNFQKTIKQLYIINMEKYRPQSWEMRNSRIMFTKWLLIFCKYICEYLFLDPFIWGPTHKSLLRNKSQTHYLQKWITDLPQEYPLLVPSLLTPETGAVNLLDILIILLMSQCVTTLEYHTLSHKYKWF